MPNRVQGALLLFLAVATAISCARSPERPSFSIRDSTGVEIAENNFPAEPETFAWKVTREPLVDIGGDESDPSHQLFRIFDVLRLPDGSMAVLDGGSSEIRFFDPNGRHSRTVGAQGEGPGEYRALSGATVVGADSLLVFDRRLVRITALDLEGRFLGSFRPDPTGDSLDPLRLYRLAGAPGEDGLLFLPRGHQAQLTPSPVVQWDSMPNLIYTRTGKLRGKVGEFSGMDMYVTPTSFGRLLFGRLTRADLHQDELYIIDGAKYDVRVYDIDGGLRRIVRLRRPPRAVTADDEDALQAEYRGRATDAESQRMIEEFLGEEGRRAAYKPWLSNVVVDESGHIWVEEYEAFWVRSSRTWGVFAPDGRWLGSVQFPAGLRVTDIASGSVLGVWTDVEGVEHVRVYGLRRDK